MFFNFNSGPSEGLKIRGCQFFTLRSISNIFLAMSKVNNAVIFEFDTPHCQIQADYAHQIILAPPDFQTFRRT